MCAVCRGVVRLMGGIMRISFRSRLLALVFACGLLLATTLGVAGAEPAHATDASADSTLGVDLIPPVTTCDYDGSWRSVAVTVRFTATDIGSGVAYTEYSLNGSGIWTSGTAVTVSEQGVIPVLYRSVDNAGNTEATKTATVKMRGVALWVGTNASLGSTFKVTSPLYGTEPTAALYVKGKLTAAKTVDLSKVVQATGATIPPFAQYMPDARVSALTTASQAAPFNSSTPKKDVAYSGTQNVTVTTPMTVNGNLSITGSGTYTFAAVYVTGNVSISSSSAKFSFASLRVGGSLSVTGGTALQWGPTYVAGNTALSGTGQWNVGLFVTAGNVAISGAQTMAGNGTGTNAKPAIFLMTGSGKSLSISSGSTFYGLLCNRSGAISISSSTAVLKGSVLCGAAFSATGGSTIAFDPNVAAYVYDVIAPTTTAAQSPAATVAGWNSSAVTVRLSAVDDPGGSGIAKTSFTVDGGAAQTYNSTTPPVISAVGTHPVTYWSTDKAGNVEATKSLTIKIETTAPTGSVTINSGAAWTNALAATLTLSASDAGSGVSQMRFSNDNSSWSAWQDYATGASWTLAGGADGTRTVYAQFSDKAGNVAAVTDTIGLDITAPTVPTVPADSAWHNTDVTVIASGSSDASPSSGGPTYQHRLGTTGAWVEGASFTLKANHSDGSVEGANTVQFRAVDALGNASAVVSTTRSFDSTAPAVTLSLPVDGSVVTTSTSALSFTSADTGSGVSAGSATMVLDSGTPVSPPANLTLADGPHVVTITVADAAGNKGSASASFTVSTDSIPPTTTAAKAGPGASNGWYTGAVIVSLTATDVGSGVSATYYSIDGATTPSIYTAPFTVAGDAVHTITCWSTDNAGNTETPPKTVEVKIDGIGPTLAPSRDPSAEWANGSVDVAANAADALSGLDGVTWSYAKDGGTPVAGPGQTFSLSAEGIYQVAFTATDKAGNSKSADITVQIDRTQPTVSIDVKPIVTSAAPDEVASTNYNRPVIDFSAEDDGGSGLALNQTSVTLDGKAIAVASGSPLPEPLNSGRHTLTITAADNAGNIATTSYDFVVAAPPFTVQYEHPSEGDVIGLYADDTAKTGNPDGSWEGKSWKWVVSVDGREQLTFEEPVGFLALADKGPYDIELTVTDGTTRAMCTTSQTISAGAQAPWVHALDVEVLDGQPATLVARFLDPGWEQTHQAVWSIDGVDDPVSKTVAEDNFPAMDTGFVAGTTPPLSKAHGDYQGHLTVTDEMGDSTPVVFTIKPVSPDPDVDEEKSGSDTITRSEDSPVVLGGQVHLSYIQSADDVDIFEVKTPDGDLLPYGAEVLVNLRDLPTDYDVALIQDLGDEVDANASLEGSSFASASTHSWVDAPVRRGMDWEGLPVRRGMDWEGLPVRRGMDYEGLPVRRGMGWEGVPVRRGMDLEGLPVRRGMPLIANAYIDSPVRRGMDWDAIPVRRGMGWEDVPVRRGMDYVRPPLDTMYFTLLSSGKTSLDGYSFTDMGFTGLGSNTASGSTMTWAELGFDNEALTGLRIADFSAHAGTGMETVYVKTEYANAHTYVAIKGANGAYSATQPYALQVETSLPLSLYDALNEGEPEPRLVDEQHQTTDPTTPVSQPENVGPLTLFVTQAERIDALYGDGSFENTVLPALEAACNDRDKLVRGEVISVPSVIFNDWDEAPWMTSEVNKVSERIRDVIQQRLTDQPSIRYVVLVGSDEVIPQRRAPDQTVLANEGDYFTRSWLKAKGSVAASMYDCTVLTDDYYVDAQPVPYNGRSLYIPDVAVSRLVETPAEINATIMRFLQARGVLAGGSSVVTGQDFMADGAERVRAILAQADLAPKMENPTNPDIWTADNVRQDLLTAPSDLGSINGHFVHYGGISASGWYRSLDGLDFAGEFLSSSEIADATAYPDFVGKLVFTMGCHAGLSVPDDQTGVSDDYVGDPDPRLDIAQAMARRQGVLVGSTGYGYGDTEAVAGTEALIGTFADQMTTTVDANAAKGQPIGLALAEAKRQYLGALSAVTPYDEKSSIQFAMYGMPQYRLACDAHPPVGGMTVVGVVNPGSAGLDLGFPDTPFNLTVSDVGKPDKLYPTVQLREASTAATARFITADGDAQATADRAIQPRVVVNLGVGGDDPVKSAIVTGGTYVDYAGFNPAISRWTYEWEVDPQEPQVWTDGWWPSHPVTVRTIDTLDGSKQKVIVHPGQFLATSGGENGVTGTERVWSSLNVELIRGSAADNIPPTVSTVDLVKSGDTVTAKVTASDASDISRIDVTQDRGGSAAHQSFSPVSVSGDGTYDVSFDAPGIQLSDVAVTIYVVDGAGNVTATTGKGELVPSATHALTASAGAHGSITPSGTVIASDGADQSFAITPDANYRVADVVVDGVSQGAITSYSFTNVAEDHTIAASFVADQVALTLTTVGQGSVAKAPDLAAYDAGSSVTLTATPIPAGSSPAGAATSAAPPTH